MDFAIVLVAAGASTRMGFPKLWVDVCGQPLIAYAIDAARAVQPSELVVVVSPERMADTISLRDGVQLIAGGARRRDSVAAGLSMTRMQWVAIHDAARALAPPELFLRGLDAAQDTGAAIPALPLKDTIKRVVDARVVDTPARAEYMAVQTPQVFRRDFLQNALALTDEDVTDEASLIEMLGVRVAVFPGDERAFKVTTRLDFALARALVDSLGGSW
jgi:2-C-methyl-D-erythritol 4-phosphate cytidylyltransferase/2-C-methyl-D-erythritol 2,4-cyclodiphosphate synthase